MTDITIFFIHIPSLLFRYELPFSIPASSPHNALQTYLRDTYVKYLGNSILLSRECHHDQSFPNQTTYPLVFAMHWNTVSHSGIVLHTGMISSLLRSLFYFSIFLLFLHAWRFVHLFKRIFTWKILILIFVLLISFEFFSKKYALKKYINFIYYKLLQSYDFIYVKIYIYIWIFAWKILIIVFYIINVFDFFWMCSFYL